MFTLESEPHDQVLRGRLQEITDRLIADQVGLQVEAVARLSEAHPHCISLVEQAIPDRADTWRYTCYMYAFELHPPPRAVQQIAGAFGAIFPGSAFVNFLIDRHLDEVAPGEVVQGDVVVYLAADSPKHAGKVDSGAVVSKWGTAHLWRHRLFEVPSSHGDVVRFFRGMQRTDALGAFLEYARASLGPDVVEKSLRRSNRKHWLQNKPAT